MLNKNKIRLMSILAVYDKKFGAADRKKSGYFKWDYIYFRNFWTRLGVFSGCMIITLFYVLNMILVDQSDLLLIDWKYEATKIGFFTIAALVVYTGIGTLVAKAEYKQSKDRLNAYFMMLDKLDEISGSEQVKPLEDSGFEEPWDWQEQIESKERREYQRRIDRDRAPYHEPNNGPDNARRYVSDNAGYYEQDRVRESSQDTRRGEQPRIEPYYGRAEDASRDNKTFKAKSQVEDLMSRLKEARENGANDDY